MKWSTRTSVVWSCCFSLSFLLLNEEVWWVFDCWWIKKKKSDFGPWPNLMSIITHERVGCAVKQQSDKWETAAPLYTHHIRTPPFTSQTCTCTHFCWAACAHVSFTVALPPPPPKQLDFTDPPKERQGKSAQDSSWGNSLADDCKVVGREAAAAAAACLWTLCVRVPQLH